MKLNAVFRFRYRYFLQLPELQNQDERQLAVLHELPSRLTVSEKKANLLISYSLKIIYVRKYSVA